MSPLRAPAKLLLQPERPAEDAALHNQSLRSVLQEDARKLGETLRGA